AYWTLHRRFGSLPWADLVAPATLLAEDGVAVSHRLASGLRGLHRKRALHDSAPTDCFPDGEPPGVGGIFRRAGYARTLRRFADGGAEAFYRGPIADEIVEYAQAAGGLFTSDDFAGQTTEVYDPIRTTYRGVDVYQTRPPSQGLLVLEQLNLLE